MNWPSPFYQNMPTNPKYIRLHYKNCFGDSNFAKIMQKCKTGDFQDEYHEIHIKVEKAQKCIEGAKVFVCKHLQQKTFVFINTFKNIFEGFF